MEKIFYIINLLSYLEIGMKKKIILIIFVLIIFLFSGCNQLSNNDDSSSDNGDNVNNGNNNIVSMGPTIQELVNRERQYNYSYSVQSISCRDGQDCKSPTNSTVKIGNSFGYTLTISHKTDYDSYYLTDYNDMVVRQWAPGYEILGSELECHGFSIANDPPRKTLIDLNAQIIGREQMLVDGEWIDCTHVIYYTYQKDDGGNDTEDISMIYEQWIWNDYGVKVKTHTYRPPDDPHLPDFDVTSTMYNFVFNELTILDFAYPDPCTILD
jgi:hypothetical protein